MFDQERYTKVIEARMLRSLVEFLDDRGVDTSELVAREETINNNNISVGDNAVIVDSQFAVGQQARATSRLPRVRVGKEKGKEKPDGGKS